MSPKLWEKSNTSLDKKIEEFEVGDDYLLDMHLAPFDVYGNAAQAHMLHKIGILSEDERSAILKELGKILQDIRNPEESSFHISIQDEDIHTKIENLLIERIGSVGKKIHTARSRNDQVLLDTRLYSKYSIQTLLLHLTDFDKPILKFAKKYEFVTMPGYKHMQIAMPSSVGMWASSFVESIIDEIHLFEQVHSLNDMNPLGSGAGYGVSIDIDRDYTTKLLGFGRVQKNSIYCGNSRGKVAAHIINSIAGFGLILNKIATDLLLFTMKEFQFFTFNDSIATGSSIMPQKKNLDVLELVRGKTHSLLANQHQIHQLIANLPSGYNRDYQESKRLLISSFTIITQMVNVVKIVFSNLTPNEERLRAAHLPEIYATDVAYQKVKEGVPFRDAYREVGENLGSIKVEDPVENIKSKKHIGATGNLHLSAYEVLLKELSNKWENASNEWKKKLDHLF